MPASAPIGLFPERPTPRLYDRIVQVMRARHYSPRTEKVYLNWIGAFIAFHGWTHPRALSEQHANEFLTDLAVRKNVAASTQNQALAALLFLYEHVLEQPLDRIQGVVRARKPKRLPVVLTRTEVAAVIANLSGVSRIVAGLLYGSGLRLSEALSLRVKDLDLERGEILVRDGKGAKDRVRSPARSAGSTPMPTANGAGNGCSRRPRTTPTARLACGTGTTCTRV